MDFIDALIYNAWNYMKKLFDKVLAYRLLSISRFRVMQVFEIVGLIFFCVRMHYGYFLR